MVTICDKNREPSLLEYLKEEAVYNTFLLADIVNYGFDKEFQTIYGDMEEDGLKGVYLKFYNNLIVYSHKNIIDRQFLSTWFKDWKPEVVMGKSAVVKEIYGLLPDYQYKEEPLYLLDKREALVKAGCKENGFSDGTIKKASIGDAGRIYEFLMTIKEIKAMYSSREMIEERLKTGDGVHYIMEKDGKIIGHANSTAKSQYTVMIGGVATAFGERGRGIAGSLVYTLAKEILDQGKKPCLFSKQEAEHNVYVSLGFHKAGTWGVMARA